MLDSDSSRVGHRDEGAVRWAHLPQSQWAACRGPQEVNVLVDRQDVLDRCGLQLTGHDAGQPTHFRPGLLRHPIYLVDGRPHCLELLLVQRGVLRGLPMLRQGHREDLLDDALLLVEGDLVLVAVHLAPGILCRAFFPLAEVEPCVEHVFDGLLDTGLGADDKVVHLDEDLGLVFPSFIKSHPPARLHQVSNKVVLGQVAHDSVAPCGWSIVQSVHRYFDDDDGVRWESKSLRRLGKDRASGSSDRITLAESIANIGKAKAVIQAQAGMKEGHHPLR